MQGEDGSAAQRLGGHVRAVRRARGLTLVQLAGRAGLSHPFLSQLERGLARPSMASLEAIAQALGSSQLELLAGTGEPVPEPSAPSLVRAGDGEQGPYGQGRATLLVRGGSPFTPLLFEARNREPGEVHRHDEDEFLHVVDGACTVDLGPAGCHELRTGDSLHYAGGTPHQWFSPTGAPYRLFVVKQQLALGRADRAAAWDPGELGALQDAR